MAVLTITTTAPLDTRLVAAFGAYLRLGRNATQAEIKADLIRYAAQVVQDQERVASIAAIVNVPFDPT